MDSGKPLALLKWEEYEVQREKQQWTNTTNLQFLDLEREAHS